MAGVKHSPGWDMFSLVKAKFQGNFSADHQNRKGLCDLSVKNLAYSDKNNEWLNLLHRVIIQSDQKRQCTFRINHQLKV